MKWTLPICGLLALATIPEVTARADEETAKKSLLAYLKVFGQADTAAMASHYAPEITVLAGATLLDKKYGGLGGEDGTEKNQVVKRDRLLKAYEKAIEAFGGKDDWVSRHDNLKDQDVRLKTLTAEDVAKDKGDSGVKAGDVAAVVIPKGGDRMVFILRRDTQGAWVIVAEFWD